MCFASSPTYIYTRVRMHHVKDIYILFRHRHKNSEHSHQLQQSHDQDSNCVAKRNLTDEIFRPRVCRGVNNSLGFRHLLPWLLLLFHFAEPKRKEHEQRSRETIERGQRPRKIPRAFTRRAASACAETVCRSCSLTFNFRNWTESGEMPPLRPRSGEIPAAG